VATITQAQNIDVRKPQRIGQHLYWYGNLTMTGSYATNGDLLNANRLGMTAILGGIIANKGDTAFEVIPQPDGTALVLCRVMSTGLEVANGVSLATLAPWAQIIGR
jgi:hypothetical protein